ncbi:hypothetical protein OROMI_024814 [Orobanche minor]
MFTYIKSPRNGSVCYFSSKLDVPSNVVQKKRVARILFFKIRPSQQFLKIRDGTPLRGGGNFYIHKSPRNGSVCYFSSKLDVPSNVVQKKRVARILFFKIWSSQGILKVRDCTPMEAEDILTYIKSPRNGSKRVARILFFKIRSSQENLKIRDGTPLEAEEMLTYIKSPRNGSVCYFSSKLDVPSNVVQKKRVARILFFKIRPSQKFLKIRDGTPLRGGGNFYIHKKPSKRIDVPSNVVQKKRVARILFFKIRPSQEIKIRDGTPLEAEEMLTYIKSPRNGSVCYFSSKLDVPSNVVQKKRVARILFFKIRPSQKFLKIRDGTPLRDFPSNVVQKKRVARILFFKIRPSQEILKIRDGTPLEAEEILTYIKCPRNGSVCYFSSQLDVSSNVVHKKRVARILFFKIRPSQKFLKIRDGTPLRVEMLTYIKSPRNGSKRVARILFFKIRPSQKILKIRDEKSGTDSVFKIWSSQGILKVRDCTPMEAEDILTYIKSPRNGSKRVARILFFKIRSSQEILKIRDGTPLEAEEMLTYIKSPRNGSVCYFSSKLDVPSNVVQNKRVARILFFKIRPSQKFLKIRDGTPLRGGGNFYIHKSPRNGSVCYFSSKLDVPSNVVQKKRVARILFFKIRPSQKFLKIRDGTPLRVARVLFFKIWSSQGILKVRDCTPMEAEDILTYIKSPRNGSKRVARILFFKIRSSQEILKIRDGTPLEAEEMLTYIKALETVRKLDVPSNVVQKKRVARILFFKIRSSQEILKIRDGTPLEAEEMLTYIKSPRNGSVCYFSSKLDVPSNVVQKKRVARILFFKIRPSQEILKIRDGTPMELDVPSNVVQKKRVARILFFKIRPSQEILKICDGTPLEAEEMLTYIKSPRNGSVCYFSSKLDVSSNVVHKKKVARILFFKIRPSQGILKVRDCTPMEAEEILTYIKSPRNGSEMFTYIKSPRNGSVCYFSSKLDVPSNVVQKKRVARILFFKIRPSQQFLKIRDGTPLRGGGNFYIHKSPRNGSVCYFSSKLDVPSNVVQKKRVARILFFKIWSSQGILKVRDCTPMEAEDILTYIKSPRNGSKRVARILFFKIRSSQEILKIRDGTPLEAEEMLTYIKSPRNGSVCYFSSKLDVPSNVVQKKRVARILFFKIRPSQKFLKIRDGTPLRGGGNFYIHKKPSKRIDKLDVPSNVVQKKRVARILFFKIRPSQEILKIRDGTPLEAEEMLTYIKSPRNGSVCYFSSKLDVPSNVVQKKRVARILFFKIRPSQKFLKIRDGTPLRDKLDVPSNVVQKKRVARILFFKIRPSQEILKICDGTPLEAEEMLTYIKSPRNGSVCYFSSKLDVSSNVVHKKKVARILFFKIRPSQGILKVRDCTPMEAEEILTYIKSPRNGSEMFTYIKSPRNGSVCYFSSKLDVPSNVVQKKRVARILFFKIRPSQQFLKIRDGTPLRGGGNFYIHKSPRNGSVCYFSSKLDVPSNVVQKKRVARILFFKIWSSQGILKVRDCTPMEAEDILTYIKSPRNGSKRVARILFFKIRSSQEILKIRDGTPLEAEEMLTYIKSPRNGSVCYFSSKLDVPSNVVQKKRVARILFFKIRPSQKFLKIRDGTPLRDVPSNVVQKKRVARILFFKIRPSQEILKIRDGTPLEAEEMLTYIKSPRNGSVCYFSSKLDVPSNVVQKKRVARILFFKIRPSQKFLKIRDGTPLRGEGNFYIHKKPSKRIVQKKRVARILFFKIRPSQEILKIRDGTPLEAEEILTYIKCPRNGSVCYFYSQLDVSSNVVHKKRVARILFFKIREMLTYIKSPRNGSKRVARILFFKIRPSQKILKIRDGTPLREKSGTDSVFKIWSSQGILKVRDCTPMEAEDILTYIKSPRNGSKRVARILFFKIRSSQEILKIRDGTPLEAEEMLTYIKSPRNGSVCYFSSKLDVPSNVVQKKRVARILFFKIRPSQNFLKIRDGTPLRGGGNFDIHKSPRNGSVCYFSSKLDVPSNVVQKKRVARILFFKIRPSQKFLKIRDGTPLRDVPSNVVQKKRVARILFFKIRPSQEILKIRDGTPLEAEEILTYIKCPRNGSVCYFSSKLDVSSNVVQKKRVARILFFKIRPSQEILKIRDGTPMEEMLTYIKSPRNGSVCYFSSKLDVPSNVVQKKRVARILFFKIRPSQEILKIRDGTPLEAEEILTYIKCPRNGSVCYFSSKLDVSSNVVQKKRVARILFFKIRPSQEILKIRDGTPMEEMLTYIKSPRNGSVCYFSSKLDVPSNVVQKKRVARIMFFKIRPSQKFLKIRDGTPLRDVPSNVVQKKRVARILFFKIRPSQEILKLRDGTPLEAEEILTYIKCPRNGSVCYFSSQLDVSSNVVHKKKVARILFFKIRSSQGILKVRDCTPIEAEEILTYIKALETDRPSQEILKIRDGTPLRGGGNVDIHKKPSKRIEKSGTDSVFKIWSSQGILKVRDCTPMEAEDILTYIKSPRNGSKRVARILFFKIRSSQEILKIRDGTPLEAEEMLTYIKSPRNGSVCYFSSKLDVPSNVVQKKRVARILFFKIRPSQNFLKIRDGTPLRGGGNFYIHKSPRNGSVCYFSSKLDVPSNVVQKKRVARILFFKIRPSQKFLKIRDGTPLRGILKVRDCTPMEAEDILTYIKSPRNGSKRVARILFFKIRSSQEILKIRDGTPLEAEEMLTYIKSPRNGSVCYFSSKLDVPSNVVQKKRVARILFFKIRPSQKFLKIRDGTPLRGGGNFYIHKKPSKRIESSQEILKIRDGTPMEAEEMLTYIKALETKRVARILFFKIRPSQNFLKIRDGTPLRGGGNFYIHKSPRNGSVCYFFSKLDVPSNVVQKKRVARILFFKIRPSQKFLKVRDGTPLRSGGNFYIHKKPSQRIEVRDCTPIEEMLTYIKSPRNGSKRVARILFFKIRPSQKFLKIRDEEKSGTDSVFKIRSSQEILKIRDGTPLEAEEMLTYIKSPRNGSVCYFSSKLDVPSNVVQKKRVARILFFKIRPSQKILKIRDGTPLRDVPSNVVQKKRVARVLFFKIWSSQGILKVRDCTPMEAEDILTYIKSPRNGSKRVARILFFKIRSSQEILKIRDGTPLEAEEMLTYIKSPRNGSVCYFSSKLDVTGNVVQKKRVARILFFKIRPSQEIFKIRDGTPLEAEEILTYIKCPRNGSVCYFSSKLDVSSNVVQKKRVARILFFKIRPSQEILKIRDGTPMEAE